MILLATLTTIYIIGYVASIKASNKRADSAPELDKMRSEKTGFYYVALLVIALFWPILVLLGLITAASR